MLMNDLVKDFKILCIAEGVKMIELAERLNVSRSAVSSVIRCKNIVNKAYVRVFEAAGYDVKLVYVKHEKNTEPNDFVKDFKIKCIESNMTIERVAKKLKVPNTAVFDAVRGKHIINASYIRNVRALGYDIRVEYPRREFTHEK